MTELGATPTAGGTRFAVWSERATGVEIALFDGDRERRVPLQRGPHAVWSAEVPGVGAGSRYGLRVDGPWDPVAGDRFNPAKLLIDPYARLLDGPVRVAPAHHDGARRDPTDTAPLTAKGIVLAALPAVDDGERPRTPWAETVICELHVRGYTRLHPAVPEAQRGTYAGLAHPEVIAHLQRLGVTAVELLPVQQAVTRRWLADRGLTDYWGYNPIALRAPDPRFAAGDDPRGELREMVRAFHAGGIEVLLDVVFNHTGEGAANIGPTLSLRGIDNRGHYRLNPADPSRDQDQAGTGNTLDAFQPAVVDLAVAALRTFAIEYGVDGFRFDLAASLARASSGEPIEPPAAAPLLAAIDADPLLSGLKRIAEPWDIARGGYRLGAFPPGWREWNDRFRDGLRRFWLGSGLAPDLLAARLSGSGDLFAGAAGGGSASLNYVTAHDGFTLRDLVSYRRRHNLANGERNRDGERSNHSTNLGVEGETDDPFVNEARLRLRRALLAGLALASGAPMLLAGDELGRTQAGNNNAYCQDGPLSWLDWASRGPDAELAGYVGELFAARRAHPQLAAATWVPQEGIVMAPAVALATAADEELVLLANPAADPAAAFLPDAGADGWRVVVSSWPLVAGPSAGRVEVPGRSLVLLARGAD